MELNREFRLKAFSQYIGGKMIWERKSFGSDKIMRLDFLQYILNKIKLKEGR